MSEQLDIFEELEAAGGFDGWEIFDAPLASSSRSGTRRASSYGPVTRDEEDDG
jgi:hypothetical protein